MAASSISELTNKDNIDREAVVRCRLYHIGELQQVSDAVGYRCKRCGETYDNKPKKCNRNINTGTQCGCTEFQKRAEIASFDDQRFIEVNPSFVNELGDHEVNEMEMFLIDLRGKLATDFEYSFGDMLEIRGKLQYAESTRKGPNPDLNTFFMYLLATEVKRIDESLVKKTVVLTEEDRDDIKTWAAEQGEHLKEMLVASFAAHIFGQELFKEFVLYQIVGAKRDNSGLRNEIHGLVVGDPSTAKTEIGQEAAVIGEGIYGSAESMERTGLVAGLVKNEKTGQWMWEPGMALLTPNIHVLDEADKNLKPKIFDELITVLDKGFYSLRKIRKKDFRTPGPWTILLNPKEGKYDPIKNIAKNINVLSLPLLNRMDVIFILRKTYNKEVTDSILEKIKSRSEGTVAGPMSQEFLMKYLKMCRERTALTIDETAYKRLIEFFHKQAEKSDQQDTGILITERQFEGLVRLATANAKLLLKDSVDVASAEAAIKIYEEAILPAFADPATGKPDLGVMNSNATIGEKNTRKEILEIVINESGNQDRGMDVTFLVEGVALRHPKLQHQFIINQIDEMIKLGTLEIAEYGGNKLIYCKVKRGLSR